MHLLTRLHLGVRLAVGFGLLAAGLVTVVLVGASIMSAQQADSRDMAERDVRLLEPAADAGRHTARSGDLVAQHLYVADGPGARAARRPLQGRGLR